MRAFAQFSLSLVLVVAACSTETRDEGLVVDRASPSGYHATYVVGHTSLVVSGEVQGNLATARITYADGTVITEMVVPEDRYGSPENMRLAMETSAGDAADVIGRFADDKQRVTEMVLAYKTIADRLDESLDAGSALRSATLFQPSILTTAVLNLAPESLIDNPAVDQATAPTPGYSVGGCAPNDDTNDYYGEPTHQQEYDEYGNPVVGGVAYFIAPYNSGCGGACGPGCDWCVHIGRHYWCETNLFCMWHDKHCGAWEHFFDCH